MYSSYTLYKHHLEEVNFRKQSLRNDRRTKKQQKGLRLIKGQRKIAVASPSSSVKQKNLPFFASSFYASVWIDDDGAFDVFSAVRHLLLHYVMNRRHVMRNQMETHVFVFAFYYCGASLRRRRMKTTTTVLVNWIDFAFVSCDASFLVSDCVCEILLHLPYNDSSFRGRVVCLRYVHCRHGCSGRFRRHPVRGCLAPRFVPARHLETPMTLS